MPVSPSVPGTDGGGYICYWMTSFFGDVPLVEFMYLTIIYSHDR